MSYSNNNDFSAVMFASNTTVKPLSIVPFSFLTPSDLLLRIASFFSTLVKDVVKIVGFCTQKERCPNNLWPGL